MKWPSTTLLLLWKMLLWCGSTADRPPATAGSKLIRRPQTRQPRSAGDENRRRGFLANQFGATAAAGRVRESTKPRRRELHRATVAMASHLNIFQRDCVRVSGHSFRSTSSSSGKSSNSSRRSRSSSKSSSSSSSSSSSKLDHRQRERRTLLRRRFSGRGGSGKGKGKGGGSSSGGSSKGRSSGGSGKGKGKGGGSSNGGSSKGSSSKQGSCPPGYVHRSRLRTNAQLKTAVQNWIASCGTDTTYGPTIDDWDVSLVSDFSSLFENEATFNDPIGSWDTSRATNMGSMFRGASIFNQDIGDWDVSRVTDFTSMFSNAGEFNRELDSWNTEAAVDMSRMFAEASKFDQDIGGWSTGRVTNMEYMFYETPFNRNINGWDVSSVQAMEAMFCLATAYNQPLDNWVVSSVTSFKSMFQEASRFDQNINNWDVSSAREMEALFCLATAYNQPLSNWDVSSVTSFTSMFQEASRFDQNINNWDVSSAREMDAMFCLATAYNQPLSNWDVSLVTNFTSMFQEASRFDQDLSGWVVSSGLAMDALFCLATAYNQPLNAWDVSSVTSFNSMFLDASKFDQDLCNWGSRMEASASDAADMFRATLCPSTADPNLAATPISPLCHVCDETAAPTASPTVEFDVLYSNNFESPNRVITTLGGTCTYFDITEVNDNFGTTTNQFSQSFTVETIIVQSGDFVDPDGRAGMYALGMFASENDDLLSLGFNLQGRRFVRVTLDVSPISCICSSADGFFGCSVSNADAVLTVNLIDDPTASVPVTGTVLDTASILAPKGGDEITFQWTRKTVILDALGSDGQIAVNFDGTAGNYMVLDNLLIEAIDTASP